MARYLTIVAVLVAIGLSAALLLFPQPQSNTVVQPTVQTPPQVAREPKATGIEEIDMEAARRTAPLQACDDLVEFKSEEQLRAEMEAQQEQMLRVLGASADADHLLVAALVSWKKQPEEALRLIDKAAAREPRNALIASQALELCLAVDTCGRSPAALERKLIAADKANGLAWVQVARSRLGRADEAGALDALRQAAAAPDIDDQFVDFVLLFDRGLAASTDLQPFDRSVAAIGHAAAVFITSLQIASDCVERAEHSAEWRDACLRLGQQFEQAGGTVLAQVLGLAIQEKMYDYGGDTRERDRIMARKERARDDWLDLAAMANKADKLRDPTVMRRYLETFEADGEMAAVRYLAAEAEARLPKLESVSESACPTP